MQYIVSLAWILLVITIAIGCQSCRRVKPVKVLTQEYVDKNIFGDDYVSRAVQINPGAEVHIYMSPTSLEMMKDTNWDETKRGRIIGLFNDSPPQIWIVGEWSTECGTLLHEYQHYIEHCVPDRAKELRAAFRAIDCDSLRIGNEDLLKELP